MLSELVTKGVSNKSSAIKKTLKRRKKLNIKESQRECTPGGLFSRKYLKFHPKMFSFGVIFTFFQ